QMFTRQLSSGEGYAGGIGLGFWIYEMLTSDDGTGSEKPSVVGQGGSTEGFNLRMLMLPEEQVGLFFATVKSRKSVLANVSFDTWAKGFNFIEQFRGYPQRSPYSGKGPALERFTGSFTSNRRPFSGAEFFVSMLFQEARSVTLEDGVLRWSGTPLRRIGARTFDYPADGELRVTISFSENLQTVWRDQSTSYHRYAGLHPNNYLLPLVASLLFVALSAFVPAIWPQRKSPRKFDLLLLAAALLAFSVVATQPVAILLGDHPRVESPRFAVQALFGWLTLATTAMVASLMAGQARQIKSLGSYSADSLSRPLAIHRSLIVMALILLTLLFVGYDVIRL
ncbi:MAG: hypothetical protein AAGC91_07615, partial [Pseudomonadota bacterium]